MRQFDYPMRDGHRIPALGLGTWALRGRQCTAIVTRALELGYRHIDTADMYGNHRAVGAAMKHVDRASLFLVSKVRPSNLHYQSVIRDCTRNLRELGTAYIDLYLIHWPNERIPLQETLRALNALVDEGKVRSIGVSNFTTCHLREALSLEDHPIVNNQIPFYLSNHDSDLVAFCHNHQITVTAYSPLGRGRILTHPVIQELASQYHRTPAQICLRWALQKGIIVIPKTSSEARLRENMAIFDWEIVPEDVERLDTLRS
jgi:diketogulonate reductase-like aldo/keto reductase